MVGVGVAEGNAADQLAVFGQAEIIPDEAWVGGQRRLGDAIHTEAARREHETVDEQPAVHAAVEAQCFLRRQQRHVGRAEETEVLQHLFHGAQLVFARHADRFVELHTTNLAAFLVDAGVLGWKGKIRFGRIARRRVRP